MQEIKAKIEAATSLDEIEKIRLELFGKKGVITELFAQLKSVPAEQKKEFAKEANQKRDIFSELIGAKKSALEAIAQKEAMKKEAIDVTLFNENVASGALHPVMETMDKIIDYFVSQNFSVESGPLIEDDFHNFEALNLPKYHPARDMQDTFYLNSGELLRTHTSGVQIRTMEKFKTPPVRMIAPGAVFRRDMDLTHTPMFHQVEGLVVEKGANVSFANLKYILEDFLHYMFGDVKVRFRPSFFPFTEPSTEVDISCIFCGGSGCRVCKQTGWLEVLGSGVVDPNVFKAVKWSDVSGYAFGLGVERFAMLLHKIPDLRSLFEGDIRLLEQFK
ncbi:MULTISPECIES: phenylalanine--tRNA ligase subunit alpha [unclassified Campylobacter]|uniref:phenylalanine--tRNA ligase subunit alpha n=1 Tax=unclassified Campylobacter TaxID=2593542 RepID=UPI0022EA0FD4|nr:MULTISPECIES: phenylalanine--tRNA ligase subunit alpha [unclassified Campylobacter]MDA3043194.1 phenylalanine--tRNA ligase subunit alpha [Campylobacter sp. JMF_09 ED2]MDA3044768.1 phenylalanine--tRNA ligase subunit alpha [Campylobacter sp. JMF_07 ED4]MDA3063804.1 phenylalanine--tRNA ligase subunit alpha [Campylobacter sp. JMF_11 EL3]MDA3072147.1 phenylalanine--tRNA ligase subunit alpha [Campylobacter sp. VBCF_03 NA9]MDA3075166.1 phenylalanine--tRNA ligase subunit alpha [Campylobacter sp. JM